MSLKCTHSCLLICLQRQVAKLVSRYFYWPSLFRNKNMATTQVYCTVFCHMWLFWRRRLSMERDQWFSTFFVLRPIIATHYNPTTPIKTRIKQMYYSCVHRPKISTRDPQKWFTTSLRVTLATPLEVAAQRLPRQEENFRLWPAANWRQQNKIKQR